MFNDGKVQGWGDAVKEARTPVLRDGPLAHPGRWRPPIVNLDEGTGHGHP